MADNLPQYADQPPPEYSHIDEVASLDLRRSITTLRGRLPIAQTLNIINFHSPRIENRKVRIRDTSADRQEYLLTFQGFAASHEIISMELHRGEAEGIVEAKVTFPPTDDVIALISINGRKTRVVERRLPMELSSKVVKSDFTIGDMTWRSSNQYLHSAKGKSRAGDLELVTPAGDIVAVFLNAWSGSPTAKDIGRVCLIREVDSRALVITSAIVVATQISWRNRDAVVDFFKELFHGGMFVCTTM